jgi:TatD DNase family protein
MVLVDSHCHLDFPELSAELNAVVARAGEAGVGWLLTISTRVAKSDTYRRIAEAHRGVFLSVGTHPHGAGEEPDVPVTEIVTGAAHPKCIAIGESGLDFHYDFAPRDVQEKVFRRHIAAARQTGLPLVIHAREADETMGTILRDEFARGPFGAVLHCFSSGAALARTGIELGFYVSFSGILTFKRSDDLRAIAAGVPMDRLLVETDAPYLAPQSRRGKRNEPAFVVETARELAKVKGVSFEDLARATTDNFFTCFAKAAPFREAATAPAAR